MAKIKKTMNVIRLDSNKVLARRRRRHQTDVNLQRHQSHVTWRRVRLLGTFISNYKCHLHMWQKSETLVSETWRLSRRIYARRGSGA